MITMEKVMMKRMMTMEMVMKNNLKAIALWLTKKLNPPITGGIKSFYQKQKIKQLRKEKTKKKTENFLKRRLCTLFVLLFRR